MSREISANNLFFAAVIPVLLVVGGCAADGTGKSAAELAGLATTAQESKPFVQATRRADADYIPVGTVATRTAKRKTVEEFKTLEAGLEAKRRANDAAGVQARALGATAAPKPAEATPTN